MNIQDIISQYSARLIKTSSSPILDIELLLSKTLNKPKEFLFAYPEKNLTSLQFSKFKNLFNRRSKGEPIAYLLSHKEFYKLDFKVNKNVLIPRPETELLVEEIIKYHKSAIRNLKSAINIIEIGVGSGAIIIALAKNIPKAEFIATDISTKALNIAKQNAKFHKIKIKFLKGNLLDPTLQLPNSQPTLAVAKTTVGEGQFLIPNSIIIANLPYLTNQELKNPTIQKEPKLALDGGPDGLKYFRQLFTQLQKYNLKPKAIFLEIGYKQSQKIKNLTKQILPKYKFHVKKDLCGLDRIIILTK